MEVIRMLLPVFGVVAALTLSTPGPAPAHARAPLAARHKPAARPERVAANDLYSARARRRMASYLRMRLLELRMANLRRAAEAIEQSIFGPGR
jgi:hypothetical protein